MGDWERHVAAAEDAETGKSLDDLRNLLTWFIAEFPGEAHNATQVLIDIDAIVERSQDDGPDDAELAMMAVERASGCRHCGE